MKRVVQILRWLLVGLIIHGVVFGLLSITPLQVVLTNPKNSFAQLMFWIEVLPGLILMRPISPIIQALDLLTPTEFIRLPTRSAFVLTYVMWVTLIWLVIRLIQRKEDKS